MEKSKIEDNVICSMIDWINGWHFSFSYLGSWIIFRLIELLVYKLSSDSQIEKDPFGDILVLFFMDEHQKVLFLF